MQRYTLAFALIAASGFASGCRPEPAAGEDEPELVATAASALATTAVAGRRWVAYVPPGACVDWVGFTAEPLFPSASTLPLSLQGYCLFTWPQGPAPLAVDIDSLKAKLGSEDLAEDSAFVVPLGEYENHLADFLRNAIESRIGVVTASPAPSSPAVHVAVLDTAPDALPGVYATGRNRHGDTMAALIGDVAATPGAASVSTFLAMPRYWNPVTGKDSSSASGGDFGYLSDLSRALWGAVLDHETKHSGEKLIVNLSLGWEPLGLASDCAATLLPPVRAVRDVLDHAACQDDALFVAAAGNNTAGPAPRSGLMCPAAWTKTATSCKPARPLVVAVYGLDYHDRPIALARPGSAVPLAAPAVGAVAWAPGAQPPDSLTGTSVAAAAVSAAAAVVWAAAPALDAQEVLSLLYDSGVPVGLQANASTVGLSGSDVHRLSLCDALLKVGSPWNCQWSTGVSLASNPHFDELTANALLTALASANGAHVTALEGLLPADLAPTVAGQDLVFPQPTLPTCPSGCVVALPPWNSSDPPWNIGYPTFYGALSQNVSSLTLVIQSAAGMTAYSVAGASTTPFRAQLPALSGVQAAWLSATDVSTHLSVQQQILVTVTP
jgi:hypothetical protein